MVLIFFLVLLPGKEKRKISVNFSNRHFNCVDQVYTYELFKAEKPENSMHTFPIFQMFSLENHFLFHQ